MIRSRKMCLCCVVGVLGAMSALMVPQHATACASASTEETIVRIADEEAAIVWDSAHGIEHFIRKATFKTNAKDFGFLVPTPTIPDLAEAKDEVFADLDRLTKVRKWSPWFEGGGSDDSAIETSSASPVEVIKTQRVGGLDAVVLRANDAAALTRWLRSHGYNARPALNEWLATYVSARWCITAFKIAPEGRPGEGVVSTVVRMSFPCSKPFFPYREPTDQRQDASTRMPQSQLTPVGQHESPSARALRVQRSEERNGISEMEERLLKIYFLSDGPLEGSMGIPNSWPGRVTFSRPLNEAWQSFDAGKLALRPDQLPSKLWLTVFEDSSSPRPGTDDVYFRHASPERSQPYPETVEDWMRALLIDAAGILFVLGMIFLYVRSRRHKRRQAADGVERTRVLDGRQR